jgi:hypothetical protein
MAMMNVTKPGFHCGEIRWHMDISCIRDDRYRMVAVFRCPKCHEVIREELI